VIDAELVEPPEVLPEPLGAGAVAEVEVFGLGGRVVGELDADGDDERLCARQLAPLRDVAPERPRRDRACRAARRSRGIRART